MYNRQHAQIFQRWCIATQATGTAQVQRLIDEVQVAITRCTKGEIAQGVGQFSTWIACTQNAQQCANWQAHRLTFYLHTIRQCDIDCADEIGVDVSGCGRLWRDDGAFCRHRSWGVGRLIRTSVGGLSEFKWALISRVADTISITIRDEWASILRLGKIKWTGIHIIRQTIPIAIGRSHRENGGARVWLINPFLTTIDVN